MTISIDHKELVDLLKRMIRINSVGEGLAGCDQAERPMVEFLERYLGELGLKVETQEVLDGRKNIFAEMKGTSAKRLMLCGHLDVVSIQGMEIEPFNPVERDGKIYGRGSCDMKGGLACFLACLSALVRAGASPSANLVFVGLIGEELKFEGSRFLAEQKTFKADGAIFGEPTGCRVVTAHKGGVRFRVKTIGRSAHGAVPHVGVNAITQMARLIPRIEERLIPNPESRTHPLCGAPTLNVGLIQGGTQVNFVPDECSVSVDRRVTPQETVSQAIAEAKELLENFRRDDPGLKIEFELLSSYEPMETPTDAKTAHCALKAAGHSEPLGVPYGSDASFIQQLGIPCILLGPGNIEQAHHPAEYIEIAQLQKCAEIFLNILLNFGGND